jgi:hypothetical protein
MNLPSNAFPAVIPFFGNGGDASPGSTFISGEAGAEQVRLDGAGGAHITPLGFKTNGGDMHYYDQRGAVVTEDLMRKGDAARMMAAARPQMVGEAIANFHEITKRSLQQTR